MPKKDDEPLPPLWMAWLLGSVAAALGVMLAVGIYALVTSHAPACNPNFPARRGNYPSWAFVFAAIAAFVAGSLTARIGIKRQGRSEKELGEGRWSDRSAVVAVDAGVGIFLILVTILMVIEAWTLGHGVWPITYYVRCANDAGAFISLIGVFSYAFIIGRWMWVFKEQ